MSKSYTLKEFNQNRSRICREAETEDVVLTRHGAGYLRLSAFVATKSPEVATISDEVATFEPESSYNPENPKDNAALPDTISKLKTEIAVMEGREPGPVGPIVVGERREVPMDLCEDHQAYWTTLKELEAMYGLEKGRQIWDRCRVREDYVVKPLNVVVGSGSFTEVRAIPKPLKKKRGAA